MSVVRWLLRFLGGDSDYPLVTTNDKMDRILPQHQRRRKAV